MIVCILDYFQTCDVWDWWTYKWNFYLWILGGYNLNVFCVASRLVCACICVVIMYMIRYHSFPRFTLGSPLVRKWHVYYEAGGYGVWDYLTLIACIVLFILFSTYDVYWDFDDFNNVFCILQWISKNYKLLKLISLNDFIWFSYCLWWCEHTLPTYLDPSNAH